MRSQAFGSVNAVLLAVAIALLLLVAPRKGAGAQTPESVNRAGLVVQHGDGRLVTRCVAFAEDEISGEELLRRSGLSLTIDPTMGFGAAVCKLDGEGCDYPREKCWCQCQGNPCVYWIYAHLKPDGTWQLAGLGATGRRIRHGDVDGWVWGPSTPGSGVTPPPITFEEVCPAEAHQERPGDIDVVSVGTPSVVKPTPATAGLTPEPGLEEQPPRTRGGDHPVPEPGQIEPPAVSPGLPATQRRMVSRPLTSTPEQSIVGPAHSLPLGTPTPGQRVGSAEPAMGLATAVTESGDIHVVSGETMTGMPATGYSSYAVFAIIVLALLAWLGFTRVKR